MVIIRLNAPLYADWIHFDYKDQMFQAWEIHDRQFENITVEYKLMFTGTGFDIDTSITIEKHIGSMLMDWGNTVWHLFVVQVRPN